MPQIRVSVDQSFVKYNNFNITMDASFSGITGDINNANIKTIIPDYIDFTLPPIVSPLENIIVQAVPGGTELTFDFGEITDLGQTIVLIFGANFKFGTPNGTVYVGDYQLYVNEEVVAETESPPVTLELVADWRLDKALVIPTNNMPSAGNTGIYLVKLQNFGDRGLVISDVVVTDTLPTGVTFDPNFQAYGEDRSGLDSSADALVDPVGNTITFTIDSYFGTVYYMIYKVLFDETLPVGTDIINTANWTIEGDSQPPASHTTTIAESFGDADLGKFGPINSKAGNKISYEIYLSNNENETLTNGIVIDRIPPQVTVEKVYPGSFYVPVINFFPPLDYIFDYELDYSGTFIDPVSFPYDYTTFFATIDMTGKSGKVTALRWRFPEIEVGLKYYNRPRIDGVIETSTVEPSITNIAELEYTSSAGQQTDTISVDTLLDGESKPIGFKNNMPQSNVFPNQIIRYFTSMNAYYSQIDNPVLVDLLPEEVEYVGNYAISYLSYFENYKRYDLDTPGTPIPTPIVEVIDDYNGTGRQLVRIYLEDFSVEQQGRLNISFDVRVKIGATGTIINYSVLGSTGETGVPSFYSPSSKIIDVDDLDDDGITDETLFKTNSVDNVINFSTSLASDKKVKGELDTEYTEEPSVGKTTQGGDVDYKLTVKNIGNVDIESFEIVDILPYVGDTGVIVLEPRLSQFPVYITGIVTAEIVPEDPGGSPPVLQIEYSLSSDPVRFDSSGTGTIGTVDDWTTVAPANLTDVKSVKITSVNTKLKPGQDLIIHLGGVAPVGVSEGLVAWNSFALKGNYFNQSGILTNLLPVEPEKVGVEVEQPEDKVFIGDFVWEDLNGNGIQDPGEPGINDVVVNLYDSTGTTFIETKITAFNNEGDPGYYLFTNLDVGCYILEFILPSGYVFTKQYASPDPTIDSNANPLTGRTDEVCVETPGEGHLTIDAGMFRTGTIGDLVWFDKDRDGNPDPGEPGILNVLATLYNCADDTPTGLSAITNMDGLYLITDVPPGEYYVIFSNIPDGYEFVTVGDHVDINGKTNCFSIISGEDIRDVDAPIAVVPPIIIAHNRCVYQGDPFNPMTNVSAKDGLGEDLTSSIEIIENTVDINVPGLYEITYQVTDSYNQTSTKTILVKVCKKTIFHHSVNDLLESIALEETAISHILNAEGKKIQKAISLNLPKDQLLKINDSVSDLTNSISNLELILGSKIEALECEIFDDCCDDIE